MRFMKVSAGTVALAEPPAPAKPTAMLGNLPIGMVG